MSGNVFKCVLVFELLLVTTNCDVSARVKRGDIDLQTCIDNFNVHRDKIIRTQDSQNMGAKYLSETDLGSREECLRLCCETVNCDVFVFEEKNSGSCYLFHCGPPEDFKCKFTHHENYSSAILAVGRHTPDLENQIKLTKHEEDLSKLRKPDTGTGLKRVQSKIVHTTLSTTTIAGGDKEVLPPINNPKPESTDAKLVPRKCSRFQFECRSTKECIAIYNACDGIPQCADASDEAPELECPPADQALTVTTAQTVPQAAPAQQPARPDGGQAQQHYVAHDAGNAVQKAPLNPQVVGQDVLYHPQVITADQHVPARQEQPDFLTPVNDPRVINSRNRYNSKSSQYLPQTQQWLPQYPYDQPVEAKPPTRIQQPGTMFNHKENGLQVQDSGGRILDTSDAASQRQQYDVQPDNDQMVPDYRQKNLNYYGNEYTGPIPPDSWTPDNSYNNVPVYRQENLHANVLADTVNQKHPPNVYYSTVVNQEPKKAVNPKHVQDQMAHDLKHSKESMDHGTTDTETKIKIEKHIKHVHEQYPDVVSYKMADSNDLQDGFAQIPRGAVLSLTLGLIITCLMAILIGCRLKVVRRRMKRGGKSYAHDADYLVNGMYL
ncbi:uncharacterized protein LOC109605273 isoform X2 [Aethina tumida]|uniref:uncharacterized protein LOC109605273 isoform X2 n=1 Tax=Aethina tumida TaxID=116153 RepID=UPI0021492D48|nr:uncharacterized protein LOC109605273 isoform X2 [Aethina tumida]